MVAVLEPAVKQLTEAEVAARIDSYVALVNDGRMTRTECQKRAHQLKTALFIQRAPYWVMILIRGSAMEYCWARCSSLIRAGEIAGEIMRERKAGYVPFGRTCRAARIVDMRTNDEIDVLASDEADTSTGEDDGSD